MSEALISAAGGCHCKAVRFEVDLPAKVSAVLCNCSVCYMAGAPHVIVPGSRFRLLSGADQLTSYSFNTGVAKHLFCRVCGIKSFYYPRSNPDGVSINAHCLDAGVIDVSDVAGFDGQNWEQNAAGLKHLSASD